MYNYNDKELAKSINIKELTLYYHQQTILWKSSTVIRKTNFKISNYTIINPFNEYNFMQKMMIL